MACCLCNKTGSCKKCACVKTGRKCSGCQPSKLGRCHNIDYGVMKPPAQLASADHPSHTPATVSVSYSSDVDSSDTSFANKPLEDEGDTDKSTSDGSSLNTKANLPGSSPMADPIFTWGSYSAETFTSSLDDIYSEVVHWRQNAFMVP